MENCWNKCKVRLRLDACRAGTGEICNFFRSVAASIIVIEIGLIMCVYESKCKTAGNPEGQRDCAWVCPNIKPSETCLSELSSHGTNSFLTCMTGLLLCFLILHILHSTLNYKLRLTVNSGSMSWEWHHPYPADCSALSLWRKSKNGSSSVSFLGLAVAWPCFKANELWATIPHSLLV